MPKVSRKSQIGVALNDTSIEIVEVCINNQEKGEVITHARAVLQTGVVQHGQVKNIELLGVALREAFESADPQPFSHKNIHFSLPDLVSYFHTFYLPGSLNEEEIQNALAFQLEEVIPFNPDEMRGVHCIVSREEKETVVTYAMARREDLTAYRQAFKIADLQIESIGLSTQALSRMIPPKEEGDQTATVVIDVENVAAAICLFDQGGLRATFSQLFKKPNQPDIISNPLKENLKHKEDLKARVQKRPGLLRQSSLTKAQLSRLVHRLKEIVNWFESQNSKDLVGTILLVGASDKQSDLEHELIQAFEKHAPPIAIGVGNLFQSFVDSPVINLALSEQRGALLAEACGSAVMAVFPKSQDFNLISSNQDQNKYVQLSGFFSLLKNTQTDPHGIKTSEMTIVRYRRHVALVSVFFVLALAVLTTAITLRIRSDVQVSAHESALLSRQAIRKQSVTTDPFDHVIKVTTQETKDAILGRTIFVEKFVNSVPVNQAKVSFIESQAQGEVDIRNQSSQEVALVTNTRLLSENQVLFRLKEPVTIAANEHAVVEVYADQPGQTGDIGPSRFSIPGLGGDLQALIFGQSNETMSGGLQIQSEEQQEIFASAEDLTTQYISGHLSEILGMSESEFLLNEWYQITPLATEFSKNEIGQVVISVKMSIRALVFSTDSLANLIQEAVAKKANLEIKQITESVAYEDPKSHSVAEDFSQGEIIIKVKRYPQVPE